MEQIISKEELEEIKKIKGEVRGVAFKENIRFVYKEKGKEGVKKLEDIIVKLGYPEYRKIRQMSFYPLWFLTFTMLVLKRLFNFDDKKFQEMGRFNAKFSIIIRVLLKHLVSLDVATKAAPKMWRKYYSVGDLKTVEYDEKKRYVILRLGNFRIYPFFCQVFRGYFSTVVEMIVKSNVTYKETKCPFRGDDYHEFLLKW